MVSGGWLMAVASAGGGVQGSDCGRAQRAAGEVVAGDITVLEKMAEPTMAKLGACILLRGSQAAKMSTDMHFAQKSSRDGTLGRRVSGCRGRYGPSKK